jgi:hypothetical protein
VANDVETLVLQGGQKSNYLYSVFGFDCCFVGYWSDFGELVSVMERDPCCSIDNLYGECESWFLEMIGVEFLKEWKDVDKEKAYEVG